MVWPVCVDGWALTITIMLVILGSALGGGALALLIWRESY